MHYKYDNLNVLKKLNLILFSVMYLFMHKIQRLKHRDTKCKSILLFSRIKIWRIKILKFTRNWFILLRATATFTIILGNPLQRPFASIKQDFRHIMAAICLAIGRRRSFRRGHGFSHTSQGRPTDVDPVDRRRIKHCGSPPARHRRMICEWKQ